MNATSQTMNVMIYEILQHANELLKTDRAAGINYLRTNRSAVVVEGLLRLNYDPNISIQLPPGPAPYKKKNDVPDGYCLTDLKQEFRRMRIFTDPTLNITRVRREQLWIQLCEGLFWKEADLINKIKDRRITDIYAMITPDVVKEAFPNILQNGVAEAVPEESLAPVDYGDDPAAVPEDELIKKSVHAFLEEEGLDPKKVLAGAATPAKTAPAQRKKPGPKPKTQPTAPTTKKKPGPKPKKQ